MSIVYLCFCLIFPAFILVTFGIIRYGYEVSGVSKAQTNATQQLFSSLAFAFYTLRFFASFFRSFARICLAYAFATHIRGTYAYINRKTKKTFFFLFDLFFQLEIKQERVVELSSLTSALAISTFYQFFITPRRRRTFFLVSLIFNAANIILISLVLYVDSSRKSPKEPPIFTVSEQISLIMSKT